MRKILLSLVLCALAFVPVSAAKRALPATDSFLRTDTTLGSNWTATSGAITEWTLNAITGASPSSPSNFEEAYWNADSFGNDQYSQAVIKRGTAGTEGVAVRMSAGYNGYRATLFGGSGCSITKDVSGSGTDIGSCSVTWTDGHTLKIEVIGTAITVYDNGASIGTATDSALASGSAGIVGFQDAGTNLTNWEGGNTGAPPSSFVPAIINAPIRGGGLRAR